MFERLIGQPHDLFSEFQPAAFGCASKTMVITMIFVDIESEKVCSIIVVRLGAEGTVF